VTGSRVKLGVWFVAEDRNRAFVGSDEVENPLREPTQILVPLLTLDVRFTDRLGLQSAASVPDVTRSAVVQRSLANKQLDSRAIFQFGISRSF
jgi:hypothetical protein